MSGRTGVRVDVWMVEACGGGRVGDVGYGRWVGSLRSGGVGATQATTADDLVHDHQYHHDEYDDHDASGTTTSHRRIRHFVAAVFADVAEEPRVRDRRCERWPGVLRQSMPGRRVHLGCRGAATGQPLHEHWRSGSPKCPLDR